LLVVQVVQQAGDYSAECGHVVLDDVPDSCVIDCGVAVGEDVAESDDAGEFGDASREVWSGAGEMVEGFAGDLELSFDAGAQ
jgi:hypothetical protein